jgi:hypothetical protein
VTVIEVAVFAVAVVTVKVTEVAPCGTVTAAGTLAAEGFELESDTTAPPEGAAAVRVTVPVLDWPLTIVLGLTERLLSAAAGGLTVRPNVAVTPEYEPVSVTEVGVVTDPVATEKVADVEP